MAGNQETPETSAPQAAPPSKPKVKTFLCPNCGASVSVRTPGLSLNVVCESCHSIIDATDPNYRIIQHFKKQAGLHQPIIELGKRGKLNGVLWEVIGFMVRADVPSSEAWHEYLLFNPYYGYRWLTQAKGHWNFVVPIKRKPHQGTLWNASLNGRDYKKYYAGTAEVQFVIGEFYWRVKVGDRVWMEDYIAPPDMISGEKDDKEINWSHSTYLQSADVKKAFAIPTDRMPRVGWQMAPNQPTTWTEAAPHIGQYFLVFFLVLTLLQLIQAYSATNRIVYQKSNTYVSNKSDMDSLTTPVFHLDKKQANLQIEFNSDVDNSWFYVSGELVNNKTGATWPFERTVEYYHGYDSDGAWTEGDHNSKLILASVPEGDYYLNLDSQGGGDKNPSNHVFTCTVTRDVSTYSNYFWCLFFLSILPLIVWWRWYADDVSRWSFSDFTPYKSGE